MGMMTDKKVGLGGAGSQPLSPLLYFVQHLPTPWGVTR